MELPLLESLLESLLDDLLEDRAESRRGEEAVAKVLDEAEVAGAEVVIESEFLQGVVLL